MDVKNYCANMEMELTSWKAKLYDVIKKIDQMPTGNKQRLLPHIEGFHMLMSELDERIVQLRTECPSEWSPVQKEIQVKLETLEKQFKEAKGVMHDYDFGG